MSLTNISAPRRLGKKSNDPRCPDGSDKSSISTKCGPWCVLEALLDVAGGRDLDETLADFERLPPNSTPRASSSIAVRSDEVEV